MDGPPLNDPSEHRPSEPIKASISVVIATYRRAESLRTTLAALASSFPDRRVEQIVVADNADDPATRKAAKSFADRMPIEVVVESRPGQNAARNRALEVVTGDLVVFTDDDVTPEPGWLAALARATAAHPEIDAFGGKIIPQWPTDETPWQAEAWFASFVYADQDLGNVSKEYRAGCFPSSPNMAFRRHLFDHGWRFNPALGPVGGRRVSGSESEIFRRLQKTGARILYVPDAVVGHRISAGMLEPGYLRRRCYAMGTGMSVWREGETSVPWLLGVPRYHWGRICGSALSTLGHLCRLNRRAALLEQCRIAFDLGFIIGSWTGLRHKLAADPNTSFPDAEISSSHNRSRS